jgi:transposase-like protein
VWLYFRFALSYRNIEEMMAKRGVPVTYETVREWCQTFGSLYALLLRREKSAHRIEVAPGRSLHQDEWRPILFVTSRGSRRSGHRYSGSAEA